MISTLLGAGRFCALAGRKVVGDANLLAPPQQFLDEMRTDEPGSAGHEIHGHGRVCPSDVRLIDASIRRLLRMVDFFDFFDSGSQEFRRSQQ